MRQVRFLPGAALGVWGARILGEAIGLPGAWAAVLLSVLLAAGGAWLLARWPLGRTWPALLLLVYVIQPEVVPSVRTGTFFITLVALFLSELGRRPAPRRSDDAARSRPLTWLITLLLFVAFLALYIATLAPDVLAADSGELQVVAAQLGVAHPPGFPLYVMLAHVFTRLPVGTPAYAVNLLSAIFGALAVVVVYRSGRRLVGRQLPALLGAVALGTATTFWSQATTANVRSLTALLAALAIHLLLEFRIAKIEHTARKTPGQSPLHEAPESPVNIRIASGALGDPDRWLTWFALVMGLGLTHHVSLAFLAIVGLMFVLITDPGLLRSPRRWARPLAAGLLGLLPLLYLPLRAGAEVRGASPELATLPGFLEHVLATGFRGDLFYYLAPDELGPRLLVLGNVMTFQYAPLLLAAMLIGLLLMIWRDRPLALLLGGTFAAYVLVAATYRAPQTVEYMMPAYVPAALALAYAVGRLPDALPHWRGVGQALTILFAALAWVAALGQIAGHVSAAGAKHEATDARDTVGRLLVEAPPDSVILAHWHWATPLWYLQEVEGQRPDVAVRFVFPTGEPYDTTWARRTAEAFAERRPVVTTWLPVEPLPDLPVPEPLGEAILYRPEPRVGLPTGLEPAQLTLAGGIEVVGFRIEKPHDVMLTPGAESIITVAWRPKAALLPDLSLFLHLVGEDGVLVAQDDRPARAAEGLTLTQFRATPRPATPQGELTVYVGASADGQRQALTTIGVSNTFARPLTRNRVHRSTDAYTLIGYDWDHTLEGRDRVYLHWAGGFADGYWTTVVDDAAIAALDLPPYRGPWGVLVRQWRFPRGQDGGHYVPLGQGIVWTGGTLNGLSTAAGESLTLNQEFRSGRPINRDYVVSVRLIGLEPDGFHWAWWDLRDSVPAMGGIPTLKWVEGSLVRSPHRVTVSPDAPPGQVLTGALTLYDSFTGRPLPILDERITAGQPWIPLCQAVVE